jgi:hypothetical protein
MLLMCDRHGFVRASVGGLARAANVTREECLDALNVLSSPDSDDSSGVDEGRRIRPVQGGWIITNHDKYRNLERSSEGEEKERERKRKWWSENKDDVNAARRASAPLDEPLDEPLDSARPAAQQRTQAASSKQQVASSKIQAAAAEDPKDLTGLCARASDAGGSSGGNEGNTLRNTGGAGGTTLLQSGVYDLESALKLPVFERAKLAVAKGSAMADYVEPNAWPEVRQVGEAYANATGQTGIRLGSYSRDAGVRAIVGLLATPYQPAELERAIRHLVSEPWWKAEGKSKGLSSLTPEVIRRALVNAPRSEDEQLSNMSPRVRELIEQRRAKEAGNE